MREVLKEVVESEAMDDLHQQGTLLRIRGDGLIEETDSVSQLENCFEFHIIPASGDITPSLPDTLFEVTGVMGQEAFRGVESAPRVHC